MANVLGRLDPRTGQFTEYHPDTPSSGPHGLVADKDGNIWFTGNLIVFVGWVLLIGLDARRFVPRE